MTSVKYAVIGGTSLLNSSMFVGFEKSTVPTPYGDVVVYKNGSEGRQPSVFLQRHHADAKKGAEVYNPPHVMNQKAYIDALKQMEVTRILAVCCVGSLRTELTIGTIVIPDDFFNLTPITFFDDDRGHMVPGLAEKWRRTLLDTLQRDGGFDRVVESGTYVQTVGPRFETRAEVAFLSTLGHVIGMTAASEAVLARELGMDYAMLCMIDNYANGLAGETLTEAGFKENVARNQKTVERAVELILSKLPSE